MVSGRKPPSPTRGRTESGAWARSIVCMPESMERTAAPSMPLREVTTFGPGLLLEGFTALRLFAFVVLFFRVFLGMVLLQQSGNGLEKLVNLDRLVQDRNVVLFRIVGSLGGCVTGQQNSGYSPAPLPGCLNHFESSPFLFQ